MTTQPFTNHTRDWVAWFLVTAILVVLSASITAYNYRKDSGLAYDQGFKDGAAAGVEAADRVPAPAEPVLTEEQVLELIWLAETDGQYDPPDGGGGTSIGPFQISRAYWQDAREQDPSIPDDYELCRIYPMGAQVVKAYMLRWVPEAWAARDLETIARIHNGGPMGMTRVSTIPFWTRVRAYHENLHR